MDKKQLSPWEVTGQQTAYDYTARFCGHCNTHTDIKEASFLEEGQSTSLPAAMTEMFTSGRSRVVI